MAKLNLSVAVRDYDRTRPLTDGLVAIDGVDPVFMALDPEEIFFRAFRHAEFDICELSLSSFTVKTAQGDCPYVGVPAFVSRAFRHTSIYVRTDRIKKPADLKGKKIGVPEYQLTANVWARAIARRRPWRQAVRHPLDQRRAGGDGTAGEDRHHAAEGRQARQRAGRAHAVGMLEAGEIDGFIGPRVPSCFTRGAPNVGWLFADPVAAAKDYFKRTRNFPDHAHRSACAAKSSSSILGCRRAVLKAFERSKTIALEKLSDTSSTKVTLPFVEERLMEARALMGQDFWSYGVAANRKTLETFLRHHHAQGLSSRLVKVEELFHPATLETYKLYDHGHPAHFQRRRAEGGFPATDAAVRAAIRA